MPQFKVIATPTAEIPSWFYTQAPEVTLLNLFLGRTPDDRSPLRFPEPPQFRHLTRRHSELGLPAFRPAQTRDDNVYRRETRVPQSPFISALHALLFQAATTRQEPEQPKTTPPKPIMVYSAYEPPVLPPGTLQKAGVVAAGAVGFEGWWRTLMATLMGRVIADPKTAIPQTRAILQKEGFFRYMVNAGTLATTRPLLLVGGPVVSSLNPSHPIWNSVGLTITETMLLVPSQVVNAVHDKKSINMPELRRNLLSPLPFTSNLIFNTTAMYLMTTSDATVKELREKNPFGFNVLLGQLCVGTSHLFNYAATVQQQNKGFSVQDTFKAIINDPQTPVKLGKSIVTRGINIGLGMTIMNLIKSAFFPSGADPVSPSPKTPPAPQSDPKPSEKTDSTMQGVLGRRHSMMSVSQFPTGVLFQQQRLIGSTPVQQPQTVSRSNTVTESPKQPVFDPFEYPWG